MTLPFVGMLLVLLTLDCRNSYNNIDSTVKHTRIQYSYTHRETDRQTDRHKQSHADTQSHSLSHT